MKRLKTYELFGFGNKKPRFEIDPKIEIIGNKLEKLITIYGKIGGYDDMGFEDSKTWHVYRKGRNPQTSKEISIDILRMCLASDNESILFRVRGKRLKSKIVDFLRQLLKLHCSQLKDDINTGITATLPPEKFDDFMKDLNEEGLEMFSDIGKYNL